MRSIQRYRRVLQGACTALVSAGLLFAAAPLPSPNSLLEVKVTKAFTPNPALIDQTVEADFGLMFTTNKLTEEAQKFGIQSQTLILWFEGGEGAISSVRLLGTTVLVGGRTQPFTHTFADLQPGKTQNFGDLTVSLNASGTEATIKGGPASPVIDCVLTRGKYGTPGEKKIFLHASIQPKMAKGPAVGQAVAQGKVENPPLPSQDEQPIFRKIGPVSAFDGMTQEGIDIKKIKAGDVVVFNGPFDVALSPKNKKISWAITVLGVAFDNVTMKQIGQVSFTQQLLKATSKDSSDREFKKSAVGTFSATEPNKLLGPLKPGVYKIRIVVIAQALIVPNVQPFARERAIQVAKNFIFENEQPLNTIVKADGPDLVVRK